MKRIRDYAAAAAEMNYYTFSSTAATPEDAIDTLTLETTDSYLGPDDFCNEAAEEAICYLSAYWGEAEEMSGAEADERISILAEAWGIAPEELDYLK